MCMIRSSDEAYASLIRSFMKLEFPHLQVSKADALEALTQVFIGSTQTRNGPIPSPEALVAIRNIIRPHLGTERAIPVLVPFGPKKPKGGEIDIAELYALRALAEMHEQVKGVHAPGLDIHIRIEDLTGLVLEGEEHHDAIEQYGVLLEGLAVALGYSLNREAFMAVIPESHYVDLAGFKADAHHMATLILNYLDASEPAPDAPLDATSAGRLLLQEGWKNSISMEMRQHYCEKYRRIYPTGSLREHRSMMARYFACALTRRRKNAGGGNRDWMTPPIAVNFIGPAPDGRASAPIVYRRHIPLKYEKRHVAPWRAAGYLKVVAGRDVLPGQSPWHERPSDAIEHFVMFDDVRVRADLVLK